MGAYQGEVANNRRKLVVAPGAGALKVPFGSFAQKRGKVWRASTFTIWTNPIS
jgi:hypothetical protein